MTVRALTTYGRLGSEGFPRSGYPSATGRTVTQPLVVVADTADTRDGGRQYYGRAVRRKAKRFERLRTQRDELQRELVAAAVEGGLLPAPAEARPPQARPGQVADTVPGTAPLQTSADTNEAAARLKARIAATQAEMGALRQDIEGFALRRMDEEAALMLLLAA